MMIDPHNTICLYGHTENENFGSWLTYYALYKTLCEIAHDKSILVIPRSSSVTLESEKCGYNYCDPDSWSARFFAAHCNMAPRLQFGEFHKYNDIADTFVIGSDMIWKHRQYPWSHNSFYLNFVNSDKKKIACATSFGTDDIYRVFGDDINDQLRINTVKKLINQFDYISLREDTGCEIIKDLYDYPNPVHVIDPVFFADQEFYKELASESGRICSAEYSVYYEISLGMVKRNMWEHQIENFCNGLNINTLYRIPDGHPAAGILTKSYDNRFTTGLTGVDWINYMINAEYVITDSFHGVCVRLIMNKPFVYLDKNMDSTRVQSLGRMLGVDIRSNEMFDGPWDVVNKNIALQRTAGIEWLKNALNSKKLTESEK